MNTLKGASTVKGDELWAFKRGKQLLNFHHKIAYLMHFPLILSLIIANDIYQQKYPNINAILLRKLLCNNMVEGGQLEHYGILNFIEILYALFFLDMFP